MTVSKTKFYHTVAVLPLEVAAQLLDLIWSPPAINPYKVLKERLITLYSLNDYQRFEALVSLPLTGDKKSSHLMNQMLALLPDDYKPDFILWCLHLRCLSSDVHSHLLQEKVSDPRALALKANELFQSKTSSPVNLLSDLQDDSVQVNHVSTRTRPSQVPSQCSATPASTSCSLSSPGPCWYHKKRRECCKLPETLLGVGKLAV